MPDSLAPDVVALMLQNGHQDGESKDVHLLNPMSCLQATRYGKGHARLPWPVGCCCT